MRAITWIITLAAMLLPLGAVAGPTATVASTNSTTWSGYLDRGATFTSIEASWTEPAVTCKVKDARASFWIGFDGFGNSTVEQVGTIGLCGAPGKPPVYKAWWEMVASSGDRGGEDFDVAPGDRISASVKFVRGSFVLSVDDTTSGRHFTTSKTCTTTCPRSMAEWIVERPGSGTYELADYGTARFSNAKAAAGSSSRTHGIARFPTVTAITMVHAGTTLSAPGPLSGSGGTSFVATWDAAI